VKCHPSARNKTLPVAQEGQLHSVCFRRLVISHVAPLSELAAVVDSEALLGCLLTSTGGCPVVCRFRVTESVDFTIPLSPSIAGSRTVRFHVDLPANHLGLAGGSVPEVEVARFAFVRELRRLSATQVVRPHGNRWASPIVFSSDPHALCDERVTND